jgi:hypothetical protein
VLKKSCWSFLKRNLRSTGKLSSGHLHAGLGLDCHRYSRINLENDPKGTSEVIVHLTEQGRDEIIDHLYSKEEKKELKLIFKRLDSIKPSS